MSELTTARAIVKSCQLSSLLAVIATGEVQTTERENLLDLANDLAAEIAVFMMEQDSVRALNA